MSKSGREPISELPKMPYDPGPASELLTWHVALDRLENAHTYWLTTVRPDGRPHVMPVWAVWIDIALWFSTSEQSVKGRNVAREPRCSVSLDAAGIQIVVDAVARRVTAAAELHRFADVYTQKYEWPVTVVEGAVAFDDGGGGNVYAVQAETVFALSDDGSFTSTRWRL